MIAVILFQGLDIQLAAHKQWGATATAKSYTFTYPLAMSVCYAAVTGIKSGGSNEAGYNSVKVTSVSTKALSFYVSLEETASFFVIVFGKQLQWGANLSCTRGGTKTISFPIAFSTCFTVLGQDNGSGNGQDNSIVCSFSASSFSWYSGATTTMNFVAIGKQLQWGKITGNATVTATFPISFTTTNYIVASGVEGNATSIYATMITNKSTNSVTIYIADSRGFTKTYIAAGN